jgi:hypothetical protein
MSGTVVTKYGLLAARAAQSNPQLSQLVVMSAYGPLATQAGDVSQIAVLAAVSAGENNVSTDVSQLTLLGAYATGEPFTQRQAAWTFTLDGHKFYVLPLGPEGDWAYDITTDAWCQLQTDGFNGMNFTHGVMWGLRIMGGDMLYPYLYELDPNQTLDEEWRPITHVVTGGIPLRGRYNVGVSNFTLTASVATLQSVGENVTLNFSDDNGNTWSPDFDIALTGVGSQKLIWNALGSFTNPGRIFRITDQAGPMRIDGADVVLSGPTGEADSGESQE